MNLICFAVRAARSATALMLVGACATEPTGNHPMGPGVAGNALWMADVPSVATASSQAGILDSLGDAYRGLRIIHQAVNSWPDGRALLSMHRTGEMGSSWMLTAPRGSWSPNQLRQPYEVRTYNGTSLYEGDGWAAAGTDEYLWITTSDLLLEEVLRRNQSPGRLDSATEFLLEALPDGGIVYGAEAASAYGAPSALTFQWNGPRSLESSEVRYPDSTATPLRSSGRVQLPPVDSTTVAVAGNSVRFTDDERERESLGSGQGAWKTYIRRVPFVLASWQQWADSSHYLPHWTHHDSVTDRWTSAYPQYQYTKSYGQVWVSTDDTLRFERNVAFRLDPVDFDGDFIQADLLRGRGGDLWTLREDDGERARWTLTWRAWPAVPTAPASQAVTEPVK
ncbi:MAG: hypothetical protein ACKOBQ_00100 [Bacteroidota bacterium]